MAVKLSKVLTTVEFAVEPDIQRALATGDVILTTTPSRDPIVFGAWLRPGQHVTAVGADDPTKCEVDAEGLRRARVYVDAVETAVANGEVARAISQGLYASGALAGELGDVLAGRIRARIEDEEITIATLAGIGAQDLAAAEVVMAKLEALRVAA